MWNVVKYSLLENFRSKFYLASLGLIIFIAWLSHYSSQINYNFGDPSIALLTFGMYFTKLVAFALILFLPVMSLSQDIESGTAYFILSKKIERHRYLFGKFIAFILLYMSIIIVSTAVLWFLTFFVAARKAAMNYRLVYFLYSELLEGLMILSIVILIFTAIRAPIVTAVIGAITYFFSLMLDSAKEIADRAESVFVKYFYLFLYYIFPNFRYFNLEKNIIYDKPVDPGYLVAMFAYAAGFSLILLVAAALLFRNREI